MPDLHWSYPPDKAEAQLKAMSDAACGLIEKIDAALLLVPEASPAAAAISAIRTTVAHELLDAALACRAEFQAEWFAKLHGLTAVMRAEFEEVRRNQAKPETFTEDNNNDGTSRHGPPVLH